MSTFFFSIRKRCDSSCILIECLEKYAPVQQWLVIYRTRLPSVGRHLKALTDQLPSQDQHEVKLLGELDLLNLYESLCKSDFTRVYAKVISRMDEFMEVQGKTTEYFLLFFRSNLIFQQKFYHFMKYQTYHKQAV